MVITSEKKNIKWDYFVGIVFIFTTGSIIWHGFLSSAICFSFYFLIALINLYINEDKKAIRFNYSFFYCIYIILLSIFGSLMFYDTYEENSMIGYIVSMIASYLIISKYNFYYFRDILTNIIYYIVLWGIPVFVLTEFELLPLTTLNIDDGKEVFLIYSIGWPAHFHRFAGIWHEPGACQIVLNVIIILHFNEFITWKWNKGQLKKLLVIFIGILFTMSTMGYFVIMLFFVFCICRIRFSGKFRNIFKLTIITVSLLIVPLLYYSPVVQDKLFPENEVTEMTSKGMRTIENLAMLAMFLERPVWGWGLGSRSQLYQFIQRDNIGCSNGILYMMSAWGLMWLIPFLIFTWKAICKFSMGISAVVILAIFLLLECNERYLELPISFLFLFYFKSYAKS
mgnify:FL=1